jgi:hypothetical protein
MSSGKSKVTSASKSTIKNTFGAAGFKGDDQAQGHSDGGDSTSQAAAAATTTTTMIQDPEINRAMKTLDNFLAHIAVDGERMTAEQFSEIDAQIPTFNEWYDHQEIVVSTESEGTDGPQEEEEEEEPPETPPTLAQAMEMMRKLHLFASVQQPQLHEAVSALESRLTDVYLDSKCVVQSKIEDYFVKS